MANKRPLYRIGKQVEATGKPQILLKSNGGHVANEQTKLIEGLKTLFRLKNDAQLSRCLDIGPPVISKLRNGQLEIGAALLIKIHDAFDISIKEIRALYQEPKTE